jgi:four helix bundle protein
MTLFDHERLDVYNAAIAFVAWIGELLDGPLSERKLSAVKHLDAASQSIANNIAEGNGKRSAPDRSRFLDIAAGSALECAACLDGLVARRRLDPACARSGKEILARIVSMLCKMVARLAGRPRTSTSTSTSTSTTRDEDRARE